MRQFADDLKRLPEDTRACLAFFSRLPITPPAGPFALGRAVGAWPVAGLVVAIGPAALLALLSAAGAPGLAAAAAALGALALVGGGLHEDGLADCADGLGADRDRSGRLAIMRDSRIGTFGTLAVTVTFLVRAGALAGLALDPGRGALALLFAAGLSRAIAVGHWRALPPARSDGLATAAGRPDGHAVRLAVAAAAILAIAMIAAFGAGGILGLVLGAAAAILFTSFVRRRLGGHTGDTIGASQQLAETALLLGLSTSWADAMLITI
ncbi:adenosylcobinamide-GDP ribazoletransferase [Faunimonas sp. B44]|uniref:adenosylcobinamide-GDP ribazoletransferase n=1 Tax=Faunimonas sp. B44 TaxID=3461493 RepID=UPI00404396BA